MGTLKNIAIVETAEQYDAILEQVCLGENETIKGIPRNKRFESLSPEEIETLNNWFLDNGVLVLLRIKDVETALHIKGAVEVDPTKSKWNYSRGSGKERKYYFCRRNVHNREIKRSNMGSLIKQGLKYDLANRYWGVGPVAHVDAYTIISSFQHRLDSAIAVHDETGVFPAFDCLVLVGLPPQLNATIDRGAAKDAKDQEFIDTTQFAPEDLAEWMEYVPEDVVKFRGALSKTLVTVLNNLYSRFNGTGYHPSKPQQPSPRESIELRERFEGGRKALERLIVEVHERALTEDGKKAFWANYISPAMATVLIVLASNRDNDDSDNILIDDDTKDQILAALGCSADEGEAGYSNYLRELAKMKKQAKKPQGLDRWVFWGLVSATSDLLEHGELVAKIENEKGEEEDNNYFPNVTKGLQERIKKGKEAPPVFGGLDCGPVDDTE